MKLNGCIMVPLSAKVHNTLHFIPGRKLASGKC